MAELSSTQTKLRLYWKKKKTLKTEGHKGQPSLHLIYNSTAGKHDPLLWKQSWLQANISEPADLWVIVDLILNCSGLLSRTVTDSMTDWLADNTFY